MEISQSASLRRHHVGQERDVYQSQDAELTDWLCYRYLQAANTTSQTIQLSTARLPDNSRLLAGLEHDELSQISQQAKFH